MQKIKGVFVGDSFVGKSCLIMSYENASSDPSQGDTFTFYITNLTVDKQPVHLSMWDTAGQTGFDRIRPLTYRNTDVFFVCFSIISPLSLESVSTRWLTEIRQFCPDTPLILVGTKLDLRQNKETLNRLFSEGLRPLQHSEGVDTMKKIGAFKYIECSSLTQENIDKVLDEGVRVVQAYRHFNTNVTQRKKDSRSTCNLL